MGRVSPTPRFSLRGLGGRGPQGAPTVSAPRVVTGGRVSSTPRFSLRGLGRRGPRGAPLSAPRWPPPRRPAAPPRPPRAPGPGLVRADVTAGRLPPAARLWAPPPERLAGARRPGQESGAHARRAGSRERVAAERGPGLGEGRAADAPPERPGSGRPPAAPPRGCPASEEAWGSSPLQWPQVESAVLRRIR